MEIRNVILFFRLENYYINIPISNSKIFLHEDNVCHFENRGRYKSDFIQQHISRPAFPEGTYYFVKKGKYICFFREAPRIPKNSLRREAEKIATSYYLGQLEALLDMSVNLTDSFEKCCRRWCEYFHSDHYSLWVYEPNSNNFVCAATSMRTKRLVIDRRESRPLLENILSSNYEDEHRIPLPGINDSPDLSNIKSINRMKIILGENSDVIGALTFYSSMPNFMISPRRKSQVLKSIANVFQEQRRRKAELTSKICVNLTANFIPDKANESYSVLAREIVEKLQYEACSIFLAENDGLELHMAATFDQKQIVHQRQPTHPIIYKMSDDTLTTNTAKQDKVIYECNLAKHSKKIYRETVELPLENWLGIPLRSKGKLLGLIRLKNKFEYIFGAKVNTPIQSYDVENALSISSYASILMNIDRTVSTVNAHRKQIEEYAQLTLHEVRGPANALANYTRAAMKEVNKSNTDYSVVTAAVNSISKNTTRLIHVTKKHLFLKETKSKLEPINDIYNMLIRKSIAQLEDIVPDHEKSNLVFCEEKCGQGICVIGDLNQLIFCLTLLLENAYSYALDKADPKISIRVANKPMESKCDIFVSSYSIPIEPTEVDKLFNEGFRTKAAKKKVSDGVGIGLHHARKGIERCGGAICLDENGGPVIFKITLLLNT